MCTLLVHRVVFVSPITSAFPYTHKELRFFGIAEHKRGEREREREGEREREREYRYKELNCIESDAQVHAGE